MPVCIVNPSATIITSATDLQAQIRKVEEAARVSHKTDVSDPEKFIHKWAHHEAIWKFGHMDVLFVCGRDIADELVRHSVGVAWMMESTRYVNYRAQLDVCVRATIPLLESIHQEYIKQIDMGCKPEIARKILPLGIKTRVWCDASFLAWRNMFKARFLNKDAHPDIRYLMGEVWANSPEILKYGLQ